MTRALSNEPHSYRADSAVPPFEDRQPVTVMDGECALCSAGARLIARFDRSGEVRICRAQTELGRALLLPRAVQDWFYRRLARNRYRLFGRANMCEIPDPALRARLIE